MDLHELIVRGIRRAACSVPRFFVLTDDELDQVADEIQAEIAVSGFARVTVSELTTWTRFNCNAHPFDGGRPLIEGLQSRGVTVDDPGATQAIVDEITAPIRGFPRRNRGRRD